MNKTKIILIAVIVLTITVFFSQGWDQYLSLEYIKSQQQTLVDYSTQSPWLTAGIFFISYIAVTGLSLPGAAILTLVAGALFDLALGTIIVSFASTLGATIAFLCSRYLFKNQINQRFSTQLKTINQGIDADGAFYLFGLRLVPLFPFFMVNLVMGVTSITTKRYFIISQIGMLPGTIAFVFAGTQLAKITSLSGLISPPLLLAFAILGIMPLAMKKILAKLAAKRVYQNFTKPKSFDYNLVVIGAGAGGLVSAYIASAVKAKVALIEKHKMGGDCLNYGCVPSKSFLKS
ncbi:MAG: VTT domain-containing protein, partial [Gammaproteobacteria bacterium]|nr:VTT domain-containing protein [Gammaproteobacteria bacterium]